MRLGSLPPRASERIYMNVSNKSMNLFNGRTVGEAPQLSDVYGQYDNGWDIFPYYREFNSSSTFPFATQSFNTGYTMAFGGAISDSNLAVAFNL